MAKFLIVNLVSGHVFGKYEATSPEEALDVMARDAGCKDRRDMEAVAGTIDNLLVSELPTKTLRQPADEVAAHELALFATNDADLYYVHAKLIMLSLSIRIRKGSYDPDKALILWGRLADDAARKYTRQFDTGHGFGIFNKATREAAAVEIAAHYEDELRKMSEVSE